MVRPDEAGQLQPHALVRHSQHHDLGPRAGNADDGVYELALDERPALDLEAQPYEERGHGVQIRDGDANVIET